jgi:hypothetical protein
MEASPLVQQWYREYWQNHNSNEEDYERIKSEARELGGKTLYSSDPLFARAADYLFKEVLEKARRIISSTGRINKKDVEELLQFMNNRGFFLNQLDYDELPEQEPFFELDVLFFNFCRHTMAEAIFRTKVAKVLALADELEDEWYNIYMGYILCRVFRSISC